MTFWGLIAARVSAAGASSASCSAGEGPGLTRSGGCRGRQLPRCCLGPDTRCVVRRPRRTAVATIIAIGYPSEGTAALAGDEIRGMAPDLQIELDAIAELV